MASFKTPKFEGISRFETSGKPRKYCEVEVARGPDAWFVRVRRGDVGVDGPPKRWQRKTNNGFGARYDANNYIEKLIAQGYRQVKLPRQTQPKERTTAMVKRGVPLILDYVERASQTSKRRPMAGDRARLARERLAGNQTLPPTLSAFLEFDLKLAQLAHNGSRRRRLLDPKTYEPIALELGVEAEDLIRKQAGRSAIARGLVDINSARPLKSARDAVDTKLRGQLYWLPSTGEQRHYLYAGRADAAHELPVISLELESYIREDGKLGACVAVFLKYPSFDFLLADLDRKLDSRLEVPAERRALRKLMKDVRRRHPELRDQARY